MAQREPYLIFEKRGDTISGRQIYQVWKKYPAVGIEPSRQRLLKCSELGVEAIGSYKSRDGGCDKTNFVNEQDEFTCAECANEFSKHYLRQQLVCRISGLPS